MSRNSQKTKKHNIEKLLKNINMSKFLLKLIFMSSDGKTTFKL